MSTSSSWSKKGLKLAIASFFVVHMTAADASPLLTIGEHTAVFFNGSATARYNDNIFLQPDGEHKHSDFVFILSPGLELNMGGDNAEVVLYYRPDIYSWADFNDLNTITNNIYLRMHHRSPRFELRTDAGYEELIAPEPGFIVPGMMSLIERNRIWGNVGGEYELSELLSLGLGIRGDRVRFDRDDIFTNTDSFAIPVDLYYAVTPLVDLSLGYRYRDTNVRRVGLFDFRDHFFNVGVRGEVLPKLMGQVRVGYQERELRPSDATHSGISVGADLSYSVTPKVTILMGGNRDFETGGFGTSIIATGGNLGVRYAMNEWISFDAGADYVERDYERGPQAGRADDTLDLTVGATYALNSYVSLSAGYTYRENTSNIHWYDFTNNIFSLSATLRY